VSQASAAASKVLGLFSQEELALEPLRAEVNLENCDGCALCVGVCPYGAITLVQEEPDGPKHIEVHKALCQGCGVCMATCPKEGVNVAGFTLAQLREQLRAMLG
jgi:heterodisulfide reductase subunit A